MSYKIKNRLKVKQSLSVAEGGDIVVKTNENKSRSLSVVEGQTFQTTYTF